MNYPWRYPQGGPGAFWNAFPFQFDDQELIHIRHAFRDSVIMGGKFFAARADNQTVGIEVGDLAAGNATAGTFINTKVINCELGSLKFTKAGLLPL